MILKRVAQEMLWFVQVNARSKAHVGNKSAPSPLTEAQDVANVDAHRFWRHYAIKSFNTKANLAPHAHDDI